MSTNFKSFFTDSEIESLKNDYFNWLCENPTVYTFLRSLWESNFRQYGFEYLASSIFEIILASNDKKNEDVITEINNVFTDESFKKFTRFARQAPEKMDLSYRVIEKELKKIDSFMDYGCGRMALIRRIVRDNQTIKSFYGYDPKANPSYLDFDPRVTFFDNFDDLHSVQDIDFVYSSFVFHHLTDKEILISLAEISRMMKPGGTFTLLEETFPEQNYMNLVDPSAAHITSIGYEAHTELLYTFDALSQRDKFLVIYLNDVLINLKNLSYMPWTFEYRTIEEWRRLVESFGFKPKSDDLFWIIKNGKIKQGVSGMMVFEKI